MVKVKFIKSYMPYNVGEVAGFLPEKAKDLVDSHIAELVKTEGDEAAGEVPAPSPAKAPHHNKGDKGK